MKKNESSRAGMYGLGWDGAYRLPMGTWTCELESRALYNFFSFGPWKLWFTSVTLSCSGRTSYARIIQRTLYVKYIYLLLPHSRNIFAVVDCFSYLHFFFVASNC